MSIESSVPNPVSAAASAPAPRYARAFVVLFLIVLAICPLAAVNLWPFSNWELFSRLRTPQKSSWEALAFGATGAGRTDPLALPELKAFVRRSPAERSAMCTVWLRSADARTVRIYRVAWRIGAPEARRTLAWTCAAGGARAA